MSTTNTTNTTAAATSNPTATSLSITPSIVAVSASDQVIVHTGTRDQGFMGILVLKTNPTSFAGYLAKDGTFICVTGISNTDVIAKTFPSGGLLNGISLNGSNISLQDTNGTSYLVGFPVGVSQTDTISLGPTLFMTSVDMTISAGYVNVSYLASSFNTTDVKVTTPKSSDSMTILGVLFFLVLFGIGGYFIVTHFTLTTRNEPTNNEPLLRNPKSIPQSTSSNLSDAQNRANPSRSRFSFDDDE